MRTDLSADQIAQYQRDGFTVIPDFLTAGELDRMRTAVDGAIAKLGNRRIAEDELGWESDDSYYSKVFTQRLMLHRLDPFLKEFFLNPKLGQLMCDLEGIDGIRMWHDQALIKEPWGNPTAWHLDNPYWSFTSHHAVSIWIALDDATMQNGCLYFVPGSHREAEHERNVGISQDFGGLFKAYPEWAGRQPVAAPMKAGSCSFHNGLTAHGAGANISPGRRRAMTCGYMPDGCTFNGRPNVLPPSYLATIKVGDTLNSDQQNPLLYRRTA